MKKYLRIARVTIGAALLATFAACGGGGGRIAPVVLNITIATLNDGVVGVAYNQTVTVKAAVEPRPSASAPAHCPRAWR